MSNVESLTVEILRQIRSDLKEGLDGLRQEVQSTNQRLEGLRGDVNGRLDNLKEMQDVLVQEHRKTNQRLDITNERLERTNQRLDFFADELIRMRTNDTARLSSLESAVAELQRKVG